MLCSFTNQVLAQLDVLRYRKETTATRTMSTSSRDCSVRKWRHTSCLNGSFRLPVGHSVTVPASGRLLNLGCAIGHHSFLMLLFRSWKETAAYLQWFNMFRERCDHWIDHHLGYGNLNIIVLDHIKKLKNNAFIGNTGHFDNATDFASLVCTHCPNGATVQKRAVRGTSTLLARGTGCGRPLGDFAFGTYFPALGSSPESSRRRNGPAVLLAVQPECHDQPALCGLRASLALYG